MLLVLPLVVTLPALAALVIPLGRPVSLGVRLTLGVVVVVFVITGMTFHSLTTSVENGELTLYFGPGIWRRSVAVSDVVSATPTTTSWLEGVGIHWTGRGWLYNVHGPGAVLIKRRNGKPFLIGSDEPEALAEAIRAAQVGAS